MSTLSFRAVYETGQTVDVVPTRVHPLTIGDLRAQLKDKNGGLQLCLEGDDAIINGTVQKGRAQLKAQVVFHEQAVIYALVSGGWLPLPFVLPPRFLVDRNVVIMLRNLRLGHIVANGQALQWWTKLFKEKSAIFNPLPYAWEAGHRRKPTFSEFVTAYNEGAAELHEALPESHIINFVDRNYRAAYDQLEAFDARNESEVNFLLEVCPIIAQRVPRQKDSEIARDIVAVANRHRIIPGSLVVLTALSCLYEDVQGSEASIGRRVLKPKKTYSEADAYNALSDLRHIELAAAGQVYFQEQAFALCTCDQGLASLWCALAVRGVSEGGGPITFSFDLSHDLFPRLAASELLELQKVVQQ